MAQTAAQLDAVVERVFPQRLQRQLRQDAAAQLRLDVNFIAKNIPVAHLLDLQIALNMRPLFFHCNIIMSFA